MDIMAIVYIILPALVGSVCAIGVNWVRDFYSVSKKIEENRKVAVFNMINRVREFRFLTKILYMDHNDAISSAQRGEDGRFFCFNGRFLRAEDIILLNTEIQRIELINQEIIFKYLALARKAIYLKSGIKSMYNVLDEDIAFKEIKKELLKVLEDALEVEKCIQKEYKIKLIDEVWENH
ncbi:hypothetical protein [Veillonella sp. R32]|uniref:hypothetical protein n=1 Tax=Veillonella sp. R32 TaxID=2021312 RepID=UPI0013895767|nr:hypothetical protein [Veillonella sp. R32]KAF1683614.1 hypothetical protein VER_01550 [Veillonella sp. R32]